MSTDAITWLHRIASCADGQARVLCGEAIADLVHLIAPTPGPTVRDVEEAYGYQRNPQGVNSAPSASKGAVDAAIRLLTPPSDEAVARALDVAEGRWPAAISDGLTLLCAGCGAVPRFDYRVTDNFWRRWVPSSVRRGVVCLPCLDRWCGGEGLEEALLEVQWCGTGHTVALGPTFRHGYAVRAAERKAGEEKP